MSKELFFSELSSRNWKKGYYTCTDYGILASKALQTMIRYTPQESLSFASFESAFGRPLDGNNRWVKLAQALPWDEMAKIYTSQLNARMGRPGLDARLVLGCLLVKHYLGLSDRDTLSMIQENIYLQFFVGYRSFELAAPFDSSLFVTLRKRMGAHQFDQLNRLIIEKVQQIKKK